MMPEQLLESFYRDAIFEDPMPMLAHVLGQHVDADKLTRWREFSTRTGPADLFFAWPGGSMVIEVKRGVADEGAVAQVLRYAGAIYQDILDFPDDNERLEKHSFPHGPPCYQCGVQARIDLPPRPHMVIAATGFTIGCRMAASAALVDLVQIAAAYGIIETFDPSVADGRRRDSPHLRKVRRQIYFDPLVDDIAAIINEWDRDWAPMIESAADIADWPESEFNDEGSEAPERCLNAESEVA